MKAADTAARDASKILRPSDLMLQEGVVGRGKSLEKQLRDSAFSHAQNAKGAEKLATEAGAQYNPYDKLKPIIEEAENEVLNPSSVQAEEAADKFLEKVAPKYEQMYYPPNKNPVLISPERSRTQASDIYTKLGDSAYGGEKNTFSENYDKNLARAFKEGSEESSENTFPNFGTYIKGENDKASTLMSAFDAAAKEGNKSALKRPLTEVDAALLGAAPAAFAFKQGGKLAKSNAFMSGAGLGANRAGQLIESIGTNPYYRLLEYPSRTGATAYENALRNKDKLTK